MVYFFVTILKTHFYFYINFHNMNKASLTKIFSDSHLLRIYSYNLYLIIYIYNKNAYILF